jgi:hypothetical protein
MIEKWENEEDWDKLEDWCDKVENAIGEYHTNKLFNGLYDAYLSMNKFEDEFNVAVEDSKLKITLSESTYETSDMRDNNIKVIKYFVEEELPYYEFEERTESPDSEYGFRLIFKLKEVS